MSSIAPGATTVAPLPISLLDEHPDNPRVATWGMNELVDSVRKLGVLTPCIVRPYGDKRFQILAGHRRVRAATELGWETVPCSVVQATDSAAWKILLSENLHRRNLNVIEEARAFQKMRDQGMTILAVAKVLDCSEQRISRRLALLELDAPLQAEILTGDLSLSEAWNLVAEKREDEKFARKGPKQGQGTGRHSKYNDHFNQNHPLANPAGTRCDSEGHPTPPRLGPACASCWEEAIRDDQHDETESLIFGEDEEQMMTRRAEAEAAASAVSA